MVRTFLAILFGAFMILAGAMHFARPDTYTAFIPKSLPAKPIIYGSGALEILVGFATLVPKSRRLGALGILILMVLYLPLHFVDMFKLHPAIGNHTVAVARFAFQFVLIHWAWYIARKPRLPPVGNRD